MAVTALTTHLAGEMTQKKCWWVAVAKALFGETSGGRMRDMWQIETETSWFAEVH